MDRLLKIYIAGTMFIAPAISFAQQNNVVIVNNNSTGSQNCSGSIDNLSDIISLVGCLLNQALPVLILLAVIVFIVGILRYIQAGDNAAKRQEGSRFMLYGIIAFFVMISIWGLVRILQGTLGLTGGALIPQLAE